MLKEDIEHREKDRVHELLLLLKNEKDNNNNMIARLLLAGNQILSCSLKVRNVFHGLIIT